MTELKRFFQRASWKFWIHSFTILLLLSLPLFAGAGQLSNFALVVGTNRIVATIDHQGQGFKENEVLSFRSSVGGKLLKTMKSQGFEKPVLFRFHGENFVHVSTTPTGSGAFVTDSIFWIAPDSTMHEIEFESAAEGFEAMVDPQETVLNGSSGLICNQGKLRFAFYIANDADAHCCPTAGKVTGNYKIVGKKKFDPITKQYSSTFRMVVKEYLRTPTSTAYPEYASSTLINPHR
jgi:hypothetical protein